MKDFKRKYLKYKMKYLYGGTGPLLVLCNIIKQWINGQLIIKPNPDQNNEIDKRQLLELIDYAKRHYSGLNITFPDFIACLHKAIGDYILETQTI